MSNLEKQKTEGAIVSYLLAELNIAKLKYALDDPRMKDFVDNLDIVNDMAEASDGFVWRYVEDINANAADQTFPSDIIVNMSVWRDVHALRAFMATEPHRPIMARRQEWFQRMDTPHLCCGRSCRGRCRPWLMRKHVSSFCNAKGRRLRPSRGVGRSVKTARSARESYLSQRSFCADTLATGPA